MRFPTSSVAVNRFRKPVPSGLFPWLLSAMMPLLKLPSNNSIPPPVYEQARSQ